MHLHIDCITAGEKVCEVGRDLFNMLVDKRVDLILQGHEHGYERSKQLATGPGCPAIPLGAPAPAACIAGDGSGGTYTKGAGSVWGIGFSRDNSHDYRCVQKHQKSPESSS